MGPSIEVGDGWVLKVIRFDIDRDRSVKVIIDKMVSKKRRHILHGMTDRERYGPLVHTEHGVKGHSPYSEAASQTPSLLSG